MTKDISKVLWTLDFNPTSFFSTVIKKCPDDTQTTLAPLVFEGSLLIVCALTH